MDDKEKPSAGAVVKATVLAADEKGNVAIAETAVVFGAEAAKKYINEILQTYINKTN